MSAAEGRKGGRRSKGCELCGAAARVYCESDEAMLCWGCDAQVHGANFLVARHARALLCRCCAGPTPWRAAGPRLGPTASLCDRCFRRRDGGGQDGGDEEAVDEEEEEEEEEEVEEEEGEGENQVVPWAAAEVTETPPPPPVASSSSSSSGESSAKAAAKGANATECAKDDVACTTSQPSFCYYPSAHIVAADDEATSSRNGARFLASRSGKRSRANFLGSGPAQPGSIRPARDCSNPAIVRTDFVSGNLN